MASLRFIPARLQTHREPLQALNREYMQWVLAGLERMTGRSAQAILGMEVQSYADSMLDKLCAEQPPRGVFYLVESAGQWAGMCGLRTVEPGVAEIKRVYVCPTHRGQQLGDAMVTHLLADAQRFGHSTVRLDSAPFMQSAHQLYLRHGFVDRPVYSGVEVPPEFHSVWRFMERVGLPSNAAPLG